MLSRKDNRTAGFFYYHFAFSFAVLIFFFAVVIDFTSKNLIVEHLRFNALYLSSSI